MPYVFMNASKQLVLVIPPELLIMKLQRCRDLINLTRPSKLHLYFAYLFIRQSIYLLICWLRQILTNLVWSQRFTMYYCAIGSILKIHLPTVHILLCNRIYLEHSLVYDICSIVQSDLSREFTRLRHMFYGAIVSIQRMHSSNYSLTQQFAHICNHIKLI